MLFFFKKDTLKHQGLERSSSLIKFSEKNLKAILSSLVSNSYLQRQRQSLEVDRFYLWFLIPIQVMHLHFIRDLSGYYDLKLNRLLYCGLSQSYQWVKVHPDSGDAKCSPKFSRTRFLQRIFKALLSQEQLWEVPGLRHLAFPGGSVVENPPAKQKTQETWVQSLVGKIPWRRKWQSTTVFLSGKSQDRGAWRATVHRVTKS